MYGVRNNAHTREHAIIWDKKKKKKKIKKKDFLKEKETKSFGFFYLSPSPPNPPIKLLLPKRANLHILQRQLLCQP